MGRGQRDKEWAELMASLMTMICVGYVIFLLKEDRKLSAETSPALWVPLVWMFLAGSRQVSTWLSLRGPQTAQSYSDGSPVDAAVYVALIVAGIRILAHRGVDVRALLGRNVLILCYLLYCLVSISWSDVPFVASKRWLKDLGNPIMALVILTTPSPVEAIGVVVRRLGVLLLPLSLVFIRYIPELGREFHVTGVPMYSGVATQKNGLGQMCLVTMTYCVWQILHDRERFLAWTRSARRQLWIFMSLGVYLLYLSNSQTSLGSLLLVVVVLGCARLPFVRSAPSRIVDLTVAGGVLAFVLDWSFGIRDTILELLGRDPTLTSRTDLWDFVLSLSSSRLLGAGFMSFWAGERMESIWEHVGALVVQAHSGYIEQYLNLGYVGVAFMLALMIQGLVRARSLAQRNPAAANLRLCFIVAAIAYNYTEAAFYGVNNMWLLFLLGVLDVPEQATTARLETVCDRQGDGALEGRRLVDVRRTVRQI